MNDNSIILVPRKSIQVVVPLVAPEASNSSLGNQLFQLAFGLYLRVKFGYEVHYYIRREKSRLLQKDLNVVSQPISTLISHRELLNSSVVRDLLIRFAIHSPWLIIREDKIGTSGIPSVCFPYFQLAHGYFQNHIFVREAESELLFRFRNAPVFQSAFAAGQDHIGVHVRCGDYMSNPINRERYGVPNPNYYLEATRYLAEASGSRSVVIVSDEPEIAWNVVGGPLKRLSGLSVEMSVGTLTDDFCTLAQSRAVVTSNSTFSWWAAWVAHSQRKVGVVVPDPWYLDASVGDSGLKYPGWHPMAR